MTEHRINGPAVVFVLPLEGAPYLTVAGVDLDQLDAATHRITVDLWARSPRLADAFLELSEAIGDTEPIDEARA